MVKYKQYFLDMATENQELFNQFKPIHDGYQTDRKQWSQRFHTEGQKVVDVIREWERRLCSGMERGHNAVFSAKLAEKFWAEVKKEFPLIERVGVRSNLD
jgi:hypothetical protein